jgi:hypothetical protein
MKEKPAETPYHYEKDELAVMEKPKWYAKLDPTEIIDNLPVFSKSYSQKNRIYLPIHPSTEMTATMIREKYKTKFKINLDVYRSMLYAGRQLFEYVYLSHAEDIKNTKSFKMTTILSSIEETLWDSACLEKLLNSLLEGHLSQGQGAFSRDKICGTIDEIRPFLSPELQFRCDNFIDEELDSPEVKQRIKERIRKREYRERKKSIHLVNE